MSLLEDHGVFVPVRRTTAAEHPEGRMARIRNLVRRSGGDTDRVTLVDRQSFSVYGQDTLAGADVVDLLGLSVFVQERGLARCNARFRETLGSIAVDAGVHQFTYFGRILGSVRLNLVISCEDHAVLPVRSPVWDAIG